MVSNLPEEMFRRFCLENELHLKKIQECSEKGPDFAVTNQYGSALVELKGITVNAKERRHLELSRKAFQTGLTEEEDSEMLDLCFIDPQPDDRVRKRIKAANEQFKSFQPDGGTPTILVIFNQCFLGQIDRGDILSAMYGKNSLRILREGDRHEVFGSGATMQPSLNTSTSAVAHLYEYGDRLKLEVCHNIYARDPLPPEMLRIPSEVLQLTINKSMYEKRNAAGNATFHQQWQRLFPEDCGCGPRDWTPCEPSNE